MTAMCCNQHTPVGATLRRVLRNHAWFLAIVSAYVSLAVALAPQFGATLLRQPNLLRTAVITLFYVSGFLVVYSLYIMLILRPDRPLRYFLTQMKEQYVVPERLLAAGTVLVALTAFGPAFSFFKSIIAVVQPFAWDTDLARVDQFIHFGDHPWQLLHKLLGNPVVTTWIDALYFSWYSALIGVVWWQAFSTSNPTLRMRFFLTYLFSWILLGNLMALTLSSAGPCFFEHVTTLDSPFRPLMVYLQMVHDGQPLYAVRLQQWLWTGYLTGDAALGNGISAMPSMHVSVVYLFTLLTWRTHRLLGCVFAVYTLFILVGSVHLGWHYAIDGYVAIGGTWVIWHAFGLLTTRRSVLQDRLPAEVAPEDHSEARHAESRQPASYARGTAVERSSRSVKHV